MQHAVASCSIEARHAVENVMTMCKVYMHEFFRISSCVSVLYVHGLCSRASASNHCSTYNGSSYESQVACSFLTTVCLQAYVSRGLVFVIGVHFSYSIPSGYRCKPGGAYEQDISGVQGIYAPQNSYRRGSCLHTCTTGKINSLPLDCSSVASQSQLRGV